MSHPMEVSLFSSISKIYPTLDMGEGEGRLTGKGLEVISLGTKMLYILGRVWVSWVEASVKIGQALHIRYAFCCM